MKMDSIEYDDYLKRSDKEIDRIMSVSEDEIKEKIASGEIDNDYKSVSFWDVFYQLKGKSDVFVKDIKLV
jgi:hypothetical protein